MDYLNAVSNLFDDNGDVIWQKYNSKYIGNLGICVGKFSFVIFNFFSLNQKFLLLIK